MPDAVLANKSLARHLGDGQNLRHGQQISFHQQGESAARFGPWHLDGLDRARGRTYPRNPGPDRGAVLKEPEVLPAALDGVVNRTKPAAFRVREARPPIEINAEIKRLGHRIEVAGDDFPWRH